MSFLRCILKATIATFAVLSATSAGANESSTEDFLQLSLKELTNVEVTSVSKKSEKAFEAPAAVFVITGEDIKRAGATSIPEALRLAPGLQVARAGAHQWAISSRGFNDQFANKLLVLIDGRSVYTPLFSGVWWDAQDTLLDDIERIEVIRGPGATLWGANAVNGVINIITKSAKDTQGNYATTLVGNQLHNVSAFRHGGKTKDEDIYYRAYGKYSRGDEESNLAGGGADDGWRIARSGFRMDWDKGNSQDIMVEGGLYQGDEDSKLFLPDLVTGRQQVNDTQEIQGAHILGKWEKTDDSGGQYMLQTYLDYAYRDDVFLAQSITTLDTEFQYSFAPVDSHEVIVGTGYRIAFDELEGTQWISFEPDSRNFQLFNAFAQDKITLVPKTLFLTLGSKFEHNDFTGFEYQPSARLGWEIDENKFFWASVSRAIRTPNRTSDDIRLAIMSTPTRAGNGFLSRIGDRGTESENLRAYEAGFRIRPAENLSFDITAFHNEYDSLFTDNPGVPFLSEGFGLPIHPVLPAYPANSGKGTAKGVELSANLIASDDWDLSASYTYLKMSLDGSSNFVTNEGKSPEHQYGLRSHYMIAERIFMDTLLYYVADLPAINVQEYYRLDHQFRWELENGIELTLAGQNLLDDQHQEFSPFIYNAPSEIGRSVYGKVAWRF